MEKKIMFDKIVCFKGRNGIAKCAGIELQSAVSSSSVKIGAEVVEVVILFPITSKGETASSWIDIPKDSITDLIKALNEFNPKVLLLDEHEQQFLEWLQTSPCPVCEKEGTIEPLCHTIGRCTNCTTIIDLENWRPIK
jgi:hypothetical protein